MKQDLQNVFFLKDLTIEEEYDLIMGDKPKDDKKEAPKLIYGNKLLPSTNQYELYHFQLETTQKFKNSLPNLIITSLFANSTFFNLIGHSNDKINRKQVYTPFLSKLIYLLTQICDKKFAYETELNISGEHIATYRSILKKLHDDYIQTHFFEQEDWNSNSKKVYKFEKRLFDKFSPIVEIFHGEFEGSDKQKQFFKVMKDTIQIETYDETNKISNCIQRSLEIENIEMSKYPLILTISASTAQKITLNKQIRINKKKYKLNSFITKGETSPYEAYLRVKAENKTEKDKWFVIRENTIKEWEFEENTAQNILLAFYQIEKMHS